MVKYNKLQELLLLKHRKSKEFERSIKIPETT